MRTSFVQLLKNRRGATVIIAMGLAMVMLIFSVGVATIVRNTSKNIKSFKNASQAQIAAMSMTEILKLGGEGGGWLVRADSCDQATDMLAEWIAAMGDMTSDIERGDQQEAPAEAAAEEYDPFGQTYYSPGGSPPGESPDDTTIDQNVTTFTCEAVGMTGGDATLNFGGDDWYAIPTPTTGSAGTNCGADSARNADNSCNWGVMSFAGDKTTVTIPLYYKQPVNDFGDPDTSSEIACEDSNGDGLCDFAEVEGLALGGSNSTEMMLRVRTPCSDGNPGENGTCTGTSTRYQFDPGDGTATNDQNATMIYWQITGKCGVDGKDTCSLLPVTTTDFYSQRIATTNSEIYESLINTATNNQVWSTGEQGVNLKIPQTDTPLPGQEPYIYKFLTNEGVFAGQNLSKPTLQLLLVAPDMKSSSATGNKSIPHLEYQLLSKRPISTQETIYKVQVNYHGQSYKMMERVPNKGGVFNFTIQN